jgi:hypothetical protein
LFRDSKALYSLNMLSTNGLSIFALFKNEPEATIISWMDYYIKYIDVGHFILYYNGLLAESKTASQLADRVIREQRKVYRLPQNLPQVYPNIKI